MRPSPTPGLVLRKMCLASVCLASVGRPVRPAGVLNCVGFWFGAEAMGGALDSVRRLEPDLLSVRPAEGTGDDCRFGQFPGSCGDSAVRSGGFAAEADSMLLCDFTDLSGDLRVERQLELDRGEAWTPSVPVGIPAPQEQPALFPRLAGLQRSSFRPEAWSMATPREVRGADLIRMQAGIDAVRGAGSSGEVRFQLDLPCLGMTRIQITLNPGSSVAVDLQPADDGFLQDPGAAQSVLAHLSAVLQKQVRNLTVRCQTYCFFWSDSAENEDWEDRAAGGE